MTPEEILSHPPRVLSQAARESYFEHGYLSAEGVIDAVMLARLHEVIASFVDASRVETASGATFDLAPGHAPDDPRLRRLKMPDDRHPLFWEVARGVIADVAADVLGPDVVFHHSKLNFKWNDGHDDVAWHQDIQFYPHTNYSPLTIGIYLVDTTLANGALGFIPASHDGPLYDLYTVDGKWSGSLRADDAARLDTASAQYIEAPAGAVTVHNCRTVHGSPGSTVGGGRPLLLNAYAAADAFPYTAHPQPSSHAGEVVRGAPARWAYHDPRPCLIPPDWSGGYTSIFAAQAGEDGKAAAGE